VVEGVETRTRDPSAHESELRRLIQLERTARADLEVDFRSAIAAERVKSARKIDELRDALDAMRRRVHAVEVGHHAAQYELESLVKDHKRVLGMLRHHGICRDAKRRRTDDTDEDDLHKM
jgi:chromatin segregation and condensation protein Rec8/ScpA/Scc1 (kleisin family)